MSAVPAYDLRRDTPDPAVELIQRHGPLVNRIARHLMGRLPDSIQMEDLVQSGMIGLIEAARNFDDGQGATFETYAGIRIRGAMLDEVRKHDWTPRSVHRRAREAAQAIREIENREGRDARDHEVAEQLGIELAEYHRILCDSRGHRLLSLEEVGEEGDECLMDRLADGGPDLLDEVQDADLRLGISEAIESLPEREKLVMSLYYDDELNLREIGAVIGVTESRVCQIHGQAILRLRARVADWTGLGS